LAASDTCNPGFLRAADWSTGRLILQEALRAVRELVPHPAAAHMHVRRLGTHVEVHTPAKVNLLLEVLGKRADGYHEVETLLVAVTLYDTVIFVPLEEEEIRLECRWVQGLAARDAARASTAPSPQELLGGHVPSGPENLVWKAAALARQRAGWRGGAAVCLVKRIPAAAGLGGASSDAAATLVAANEAWQLAWTREQLAELAVELGSDVPFFLSRGAAVCRGRGERIEPLPAPRLHLVIVRPPIGLGTAEVYKGCSASPAPRGAGPLRAALARGNAAAAAALLVNTLTGPAARLTPWIERLQQEFRRLEVLGFAMSGSGSSHFGLCRSARHARRIAARLRARGVGMVFPAAAAGA
jgi:4-diphosphocytidyl-2-C-methyl-D-erythritol kinase